MILTNSVCVFVRLVSSRTCYLGLYDVFICTSSVPFSCTLRQIKLLLSIHLGNGIENSISTREHCTKPQLYYSHRCISRCPVHTNKILCQIIIIGISHFMSERDISVTFKIQSLLSGEHLILWHVVILLIRHGHQFKYNNQSTICMRLPDRTYITC